MGTVVNRALPSLHGGLRLYSAVEISISFRKLPIGIFLENPLIKMTKKLSGLNIFF